MNIQTNINILQVDKTKNMFPSSLSDVDINQHQHNINSKSFLREPTVIVKFSVDLSYSFATVFKLSSSVRYIKECLIDVLELEDDKFILENEKECLKDQTLSDLGAQFRGKIEFKLVSLKGNEGKKLIIEKIKENIPTLDIITVHLEEPEGYRDIVVEIENQCSVKEWLGGYRNTLTCVEYHNASSQTVPKKRQVTSISESGEVVHLLYDRDTQTRFYPKDFTVDTVVNKATQMWRSDLFIPSKTDKIITPRTYTPYEKFYAEHCNISAIITIQRAFKRWVHGKRFRQLITTQKNLIEDMKKQKLQILKEQDDKEREVITGAAYPVKRDDFYMLYLMVGNWWKKEWRRICDLRTLEPKLAESSILLEQEIQLLRDIEKHRIVMKEEALKKTKMRFLNEISRPIMFKSSKGQMLAIEDKTTERAREFKEIYSALSQKDIFPKDRIELLIMIKECFTLNYMSYEFANDLISLFDREIDLLTIGIKLDDLKGLHARIEQLFLHFLRQEEFNPKAAKYKQPNWPKTIHRLFRCTRCHKDLPVSKYPVHVRMMSFDVCKSCTWLHNIGHKREDMSPFMKLKKHVQNTEMEKCCHTAVSFILQPIGMAHLTNVIWHGHSAISECSDLSKLQHVRWLHDVEWAPWNTILLTDQEAKCHTSLNNVFDFYTPSFIENIRQKHILARLYFLPLLKMDHDIRTSGVWANIRDAGPFQHPSHAEEMATDDKKLDLF